MDLQSLNYSIDDEAELVREQFRRASELFLEEAYANGEPLMCQLHDVFGTYGTPHHNCLGCNFADSTDLIASFLRQYPAHVVICHAYSTFIMLLYLLVERIDTIFAIIGLNEAYRSQHFGVLVEVRRWANFLKHPKAFLLTHHPSFSFSGSPKEPDLRKGATVVIDRGFINEYYTSNDKDKRLFKILENKQDVLVIFPDPVDLTRRICQAIRDTQSVVRDNPVYKFALESHTTFLDYWVDAPSA